jgi:hypothetical protein
MLKPIRLIFTVALLALCSLGLWLWRGQRPARSSRSAGDQVPTKAWAEIAAAGSSASEPYGEPQQIGTITDRALAEISGITASRTAPGLWWVHNDGGNQARLYAINSAGKLLGAFDVTGAQNVDWEDLASGPGRDGAPALYLADIGNNNRSRSELVVYRVREPDLSKGVIPGSTEAAEALPFRYPESRHDAEAMFVDPASGRIYIITKTRNPPCEVYRFPLPLRPGQRVTLEAVQGSALGDLSRLRLVTGAAAAPDGSRVVVRTYFSAFELRRTEGGAFETVFNAEPRLVSMPIERQGEAIAYPRDGKSLVTTSERLPAPIYQMTLVRAKQGG